MDDNLLAGIFDARDQIKEWRASAPIPTEPVTLAGDRPVASVAANGQQQQQPAAGASQGRDAGAAPANADSTAKKPIDHFMGDLFTVAVVGAVQRTDTSKILSKNVHVEYGIAVTRLCDGASRTVYRRFREIKQFYYDLISLYPEVEMNKHIRFPSYESWLSSSSSDPHSEIVIRRKVDLQAFFSELFQQYPKLLETMRTVHFLEIHNFPPRSSSSYSIHYGSLDTSASSATPASNPSDADCFLQSPSLDATNVVYDAKKGRLIVIHPQENWQSYRNQTSAEPLSLVEFLSFAEEEAARKEKERLRKEQQQQQQQQAGVGVGMVKTPPVPSPSPRTLPVEKPRQ